MCCMDKIFSLLSMLLSLGKHVSFLYFSLDSKGWLSFMDSNLYSQYRLWFIATIWLHSLWVTFFGFTLGFFGHTCHDKAVTNLRATQWAVFILWDERLKMRVGKMILKISIHCFHHEDIMTIGILRYRKDTNYLAKIQGRIPIHTFDNL